MKKLNAAVDRFARMHPRFGIPNLMKYIVIGNIIVYLLAIFADPSAVTFLAFDWNAILHGEIWRLVTFIFMPGYYSRGEILWLALFLYLYYMIGGALEREWGSAKFSLYYLSGILLTIIVGVITGIVTNGAVRITGTGYINLSMFFAFALLYPETRFYVFYILPVKVKWLAMLDALIFAINIVSALVYLDLLNALLPVIALLNFFVFFWTNITEELSYRRGRARHQTAHKTIQFKSAVRQQKMKDAERGYHHKCAVCGRTDADYPDLEFRYCSRCAGYHCFCQDHIFSHEHFSE